MAKQGKTATIFGGTGFVGRQIVRELASKGYVVKVATRIPERAYFLRPSGTVGQIVPFACDYSEPASIAAAVHGAEVVVNCIGILYEKRKGGFETAHHDIPAAIAKACKKENITRFVHVSSLGVNSDSEYGKSKLKGDKAVMKHCASATILRPSVIFGPDDSFFNMFAELSRYSPFLPLIGGGHTKFQPVYVGDVADAAIKALTYKGDSKNSPQGQIYELGGPDIVTFRQVYETLFAITGRRRPLVSVPWPLAKVQATFLSLLPSPLLTRDQVTALKTDNIVADGAKGLADLAVTPSSMALILPTYLARFRAGGANADIAA
jgi:NADH dehydrogenase